MNTQRKSSDTHVPSLFPICIPPRSTQPFWFDPPQASSSSRGTNNLNHKCPTHICCSPSSCYDNSSTRRVLLFLYEFNLGRDLEITSPYPFVWAVLESSRCWNLLVPTSFAWNWTNLILIPLKMVLIQKKPYPLEGFWNWNSKKIQ